ncbi:MAG: TIGR03000 domain-containing protein [Fimbriiglobus sp.]
MYSFLLMTALSASPEAPQFNGFFRDVLSTRGFGLRSGCSGCSGSCNGSRRPADRDFDDQPSGCTGSRRRTEGGCSGSRPAMATLGNSCNGGRAYASCTGSVVPMGGYVNSCNGGGWANVPYSEPMYAQPMPISSYAVPSSGCFGNTDFGPQNGPPMTFPPGNFAPAEPAPPTTIRLREPLEPGVLPAPSAGGESNRAVVIVKVPENAVLYAEGRRLSLTSDVRRFVSPPLPTGDFHYNFRVEYTRNGETITRSRSLGVRAGGNYTLDFDETIAKAPILPPQQMPTMSVPKPSLPTVPDPTPPETIKTPERARLTIKVAPGAALFIDGRKNDRPEAVREFTTPPLAPGKEYAYMIRSDITRNGLPESQFQKVTFRAGETQVVDLSQWPTGK